MKYLANTTFRLATIMILIASLASVGFGSSQQAMAMPGLNAILANTAIVTSTSNSITYFSPGIANPHFNGEIYVTLASVGNPAVADTIGSFNPVLGVCVFTVSQGNNVWVLDDSSVEPATGPHLFSLNVPDTLTVTFPSAIPSASKSGANVAFTNGIANTQWKNTAGGPLPNVDTNGNYLFQVCVEDTGLALVSITTTPWTVQPPVGGEIIPVGTTALLLAGISTSAIWLVPLVAVAGGSFALLRFKVLKKED